MWSAKHDRVVELVGILPLTTKEYIKLTLYQAGLFIPHTYQTLVLPFL